MELTLVHAVVAVITFLLILLHRRNINKFLEVPVREYGNFTLVLDNGLRGDEGVFGGGELWTCSRGTRGARGPLYVNVPRFKRDPLINDTRRQPRG